MSKATVCAMFVACIAVNVMAAEQDCSPDYLQQQFLDCLGSSGVLACMNTLEQFISDCKSGNAYEYVARSGITTALVGICSPRVYDNNVPTLVSGFEQFCGPCVKGVDDAIEAYALVNPQSQLVNASLDVQGMQEAVCADGPKQCLTEALNATACISSFLGEDLLTHVDLVVELVPLIVKSISCFKSGDMKKIMPCIISTSPELAGDLTKLISELVKFIQSMVHKDWPCKGAIESAHAACKDVKMGPPAAAFMKSYADLMRQLLPYELRNIGNLIEKIVMQIIQEVESGGKSNGPPSLKGTKEYLKPAYRITENTPKQLELLSKLNAEMEAY